jgi:hypothetical protein
MKNSILADGSAVEGFGGNVCSLGATVIMEDSKVLNGEALYFDGGNFFASGGSIELTRAEVMNGYAFGKGGNSKWKMVVPIQPMSSIDRHRLHFPFTSHPHFVASLSLVASLSRVTVRSSNSLWLYCWERRNQRK